MTLYKTLYKLDSTGATRVWEVHHDKFKNFWTVSGKLDGKMVTSKPTHITPKAGRNQEEQCLLEMDSKANEKRDGKYVEAVDNIEDADARLDGFSAMLAKSFDKEKKKVEYPCAVQPKLDGVRCLATRDGFFTRNRKPIEACEHIREELAHIFDAYPELKLDGELYNHKLRHDFEKIVSIVRKSKDKMTNNDLVHQKNIEYHIYDIVEDEAFKKRFAGSIRTLLGKCPSVRIVTTLEAKNENEIFIHNHEFVSQGYEGTMVRNLKSPYVGKRTHNLLKLKGFIDDEFEIVDILEGKGNLRGHAASFVCKMPDGTTFNAKLEGSLKRLEDIFKNPKLVLGKMATVQYQNLTKEGKPRFPVMKAIRGLKDKSDWV